MILVKVISGSGTGSLWHSRLMQQEGVPKAQQDAEAIISRHTKNYFGRVQCLKYFCGGEERHVAYPDIPCHTNPRDFSADLESRT